MQKLRGFYCPSYYQSFYINFYGFRASNSWEQPPGAKAYSTEIAFRCRRD